MNTELLLKVAGIGILVTVAYQILHKSGRDEQAMLEDSGMNVSAQVGRPCTVNADVFVQDGDIIVFKFNV